MKSLLLWYNNNDFSTKLPTHYPQPEQSGFFVGSFLYS
nr:MAG TPA: hypothetical protein [Caudoviricetes sp.]